MFEAILAKATPDSDRAYEARLTEIDALDEGDLDVRVTHSGVNFKDAMLVAGRPGISRLPEIVPGIDVVGIVERSASDRFDEGDLVVLNGAGLGETRNGGYAERVRLDSASVIRVPGEFTAAQAAAIGTAGFTAALCVLRLLDEVDPDAGPIIVTGAAGGVSSIAISLLASLGYRVTASTGRVSEQGDYLRSLGATEVIDREELSGEGKPLQRARFAGAVDVVGSHTLANVLAQTEWGGTVTACGLAQGADLPASVLPFILRNVTLAGINSVDAPLDARETAWELLAENLDTETLDRMTTTISLADVIDYAPRVLEGKVRGRTLVEVSV